VQGAGSCHRVRGFLYESADAVSTVVNTADGSVDGWPVAAADPDG